jgi:hypothetical protein
MSASIQGGSEASAARAFSREARLASLSVLGVALPTLAREDTIDAAPASPWLSSSFSSSESSSEPSSPTTAVVEVLVDFSEAVVVSA